MQNTGKQNLEGEQTKIDKRRGVELEPNNGKRQRRKIAQKANFIISYQDISFATTAAIPNDKNELLI